ncbi:MAG: molybdopterin molybdenumtransferase MoeA [Sphingobacteriales bacterium]|nr:MAG: molybdopterin molybdenumtransferase MoeA [Sphingobacteriales bacterium]
MISVTEAQAIIRDCYRDLGTEQVPLSEATDRILAQDIVADRDFPPYDRIAMDGIAIAFQAWQHGIRQFPVSGMAAAGSPLQTLRHPTHSIEVATGAMLPKNADTIIPYEEMELENGIAAITATTVRQGQNIHRHGTDSRMGTLLLAKQTQLTPTAIGLLATVGQADVRVRKVPRIAICSTGDELVAITETPAPHQIRRSNNYMLAAALQREGIRADTYHLPDDKATLLKNLPDILDRYDAVLFSGAVSKGAYDFLPQVLDRLGMQTRFHRIAQKPGKPMLLGTFENSCIVFGFPGNPVSTMVCYAVYFRNWLYQVLGTKQPLCSAQLATNVSFAPPLTYHLLVTLQLEDGVLKATPCAGTTSGDLIGLEATDGILSLPADRNQFSAGEAFPVCLLNPLR